MKTIKLSLLALLSVVGFNSSALANFYLSGGGLYIDSAAATISDVPGSNTSYIENGIGISNVPYNFAWFAPDGGDLNWDFINREAVTGGASGTSNVAYFPASNLTALTTNPSDINSGFGITIENPYGEGAQLGIFNSEVTGTPYLFFNDLTYGYALNAYTAVPDASFDFIGLSIYNDGTYLYPSYTIDYGQTFVLASSWEFNSFAGTTPTGAETIVFGQTAVPVPAAAWLFASALAGLGLTRRNRK
ncbi:MAG: VPLPA-CTERM sorting domain-containing protein [Pseudomonadota bacterium]|nr:VPLPA-CTERM sorting domain-containing protein [Pseudomonadota bacterium]